MLPRRRFVDLRRQGQPLRLGRRQHEPVRFRRLFAERSSQGPLSVGRPALRGERGLAHREDPPHHAQGRRRLHDPGRQPLQARHARHQARGLRDGQPTRSASPSTRRPATSTGARSVPTPAARTRSAARPDTTRSTRPARPASSAGPTSSATTSPTPRRITSPGRPSTTSTRRAPRPKRTANPNPNGPPSPRPGSRRTSSRPSTMPRIR